MSKSVAQFDCLMSMQSCMTGYQVYKHFCMVTVKKKLHVPCNKDGNGASVTCRLFASSCGKSELTTLTSFFHLHHFLTLALYKFQSQYKGQLHRPYSHHFIALQYFFKVESTLVRNMSDIRMHMLRLLQQGP